MDVGARLRRMRSLRGLSTPKLAEMTGLSQQYISNIENGKKCPTLETLEKLARALRVPTSYFTDEQGATRFDLLPDMEPGLKELLLSYKSMPYLRLTERAMREGVDPEVFRQLLETAIAITRQKPEAKPE